MLIEPRLKSKYKQVFKLTSTSTLEKQVLGPVSWISLTTTWEDMFFLRRNTQIHKYKYTNTQIHKHTNTITTTWEDMLFLRRPQQMALQCALVQGDLFSPNMCYLVQLSFSKSKSPFWVAQCPRIVVEYFSLYPIRGNSGLSLTWRGRTWAAGRTSLWAGPRTLQIKMATRMEKFSSFHVLSLAQLIVVLFTRFYQMSQLFLLHIYLHQATVPILVK